VEKYEPDANNAEHDMHDFTHGIKLVPITILAILLSAVIHDVDHPGVGNRQLMKENPVLATLYHHTSVAEQNSFHIAWSILMHDQFVDLRSCLFKTQDEMDRFRQVLVKTVLATDIMDKKLKELRRS
jgi:3'5'-cyclic nucleotide phosphodiesterase